MRYVPLNLIQLLAVFVSIVSTGCIAPVVHPPQTDAVAYGLSDAGSAHRVLSPNLVAELDAAISRNYRNIRAVVVWESGVVLYEAYFNGYGPNDLGEIHSITKIVVSAAVGIAIDEGYFGLSDSLMDLVGLTTESVADPQMSSVTVESALTMTSGLDWSYVDSIGGIINRLKVQAHGESRLLDLLQNGTVSIVNRGFQYESNGPRLLFETLGMVVDDDPRTYVDQKLFEPLGIAHYEWPLTSDGSLVGDLFMRPRDLAKLGILYAQSGAHGDRQVLSASWVSQSTESKLRVRQSWLPRLWRGFGFYWWCVEDSFYSYGKYGQYLWIDPDEQVVIVITSGPKRETQSYESLIQNQLLPMAAVDG